MNPSRIYAILIDDQSGQSYTLGEDLLTIGRKSDNTVVLADDLEVSRHHATVAWVAGRYVIHDVGSANGTYLNDRRLHKPESLDNGDVIKIGNASFTVVISEDETKPRISMPAEETVVSDQTAVPAMAPAAPVSSTGADTQPPIKATPLQNPYVGPRTFSQQEADRFFGREREARELHSLVISERLVLFYAQSGAGKSSLINARLVPQLRESGFPVLPTGRVSGELPEGIENVDNIYIFNLLLSLDESDGAPDRFTDMSLSTFLTSLTSLDGTHYYFDEDAATELDAEEEDFESSPYVLIIDQFEEIVTTHPARWEDRADFFRQLAQAMDNDPYLWVILTLREDYVAPLDPYTPLLPANLRARFYMQRMDYETALEAVSKPAEKFRRPFANGVAENLVDNLRQIRVYGGAQAESGKTELGQFVEPVQLQVVCYQLWENLQGQPLGQISQENLEQLGDVDEALAEFYEQAVAEVVDQTDVSQIELRNWFEEQLITEAGTRGTVYRGATHTGSIPNRAVDLLSSKFLLRSEVRTGGTWYELVHDRFIEPILQANHEWRERQPLLRVAQNWDDAGRPAAALLEDQALEQVMNAGNWTGLGTLVREFVEASQAVQRDREKAKRAKQEAQYQRELEQARTLAEERQRRLDEQAQSTAKLRRRTIIITIMATLAGVFAVFAGWSTWQAFSESTRADANAQEAQVNATQAVAAERTAQAEATAAAQNAALAIANAATAAAEATNAAANAAAAGEILLQQNDVQTAVAEATNAKETEVAIAAATAESKRATLTAEDAIPPSPTYTPTPTETATPVNPRTPTPVEPTDTPTSTPTPTPNSTATAAAAEIQVLAATETAVAQVNATQTAEANQSCLLEPVGDFNVAWKDFEDELGCPLQAAIMGQYAEQPFENGYMIWSAIPQPNLFFAMVGGDKGEWYLVDQTEVDSYNPQDGPSCDVGAPPASGLVQPVRGFGAIWCNRDDIRERIGWGTAEEFAVVDNQLQPFENGFLLRNSQKTIYVLIRETSPTQQGNVSTGVYIRVGN